MYTQANKSIVILVTGPSCLIYTDGLLDGHAGSKDVVF